MFCCTLINGNGFVTPGKYVERCDAWVALERKGEKVSKQNSRSEAIDRLQSLRNIGPITAQRLYEIGMETPEQMLRSDPQEIYERLKEKAGGKLDRCVLYQIQGAVLDIPWWKCNNLICGGRNK